MATEDAVVFIAEAGCVLGRLNDGPSFLDGFMMVLRSTEVGSNFEFVWFPSVFFLCGQEQNKQKGQ